jgi:hypothetical protein
MTSNVLVAFVAAGAAILGSLVGVLGSAVTEGRRLRHEREQRWVEHRLSVYVEFLDSSRAFSDNVLDRLEGVFEAKADPEKSDRVVRETTAYHSTLTRVRLVASDPVWEAAHLVDAAYRKRDEATVFALQGVRGDEDATGTPETDEEATGAEETAAEGLTSEAWDRLASWVEGESYGDLEKAEQKVDEAINEFTRRVSIELGIPRPPD